MATIAGTPIAESKPSSDQLTGLPRAHAIDRWIFVFMAAFFIAIVLAGFIPDSLDKIEAVRTGARPPFPLVLHFHAVLMGSFLLLLLAQTTLAATGRIHLHRQLGLAAIVIVPALVLVGFILVPTIYHANWSAAQGAAGEARQQLEQILLIRDNIMLLQLRIAILFPLFIFIGLRARTHDAGLHKRMMILATAMALPAGIDRIPWLPHTMPFSPLSPDLYTLLAISPMVIWDIVRNRRVHRAYLIWLALFIPFAIAVHALWDSAWWHSVAPRLMGL
ncbi:MAG: hypothetical protein ABIO43_10665 [Sphingomicrobium sp.]